MRNGKALLGILLLLTACDPAQVNPEHTPTVFLIGDSISMGYQPVAERLLPDIQITHNPSNARGTWTTLRFMESWFTSTARYDLIVWNNGLWDCNVAFEDGWHGSTVQAYEWNLKLIARRLKKASRRVVFMLTTRIPENVTTRQVGCELERNEAALRVLPPLGIEIADLYTVSLQAEHVRAEEQDDVHFSDAGNEVLGAFVADVIANQLEE